MSRLVRPSYFLSLVSAIVPLQCIILLVLVLELARSLDTHTLPSQGLSPFRPGTVHPYTGDGMVVTELQVRYTHACVMPAFTHGTHSQGISPIALVEKMSFLHPRRSKRRVLIDEVC